MWGNIEKMGPALAVAMLTILYGYIIKLVTIALTKDQSFHADRLRAVQCPPDITDQIGGWITAGVGQSYGEGYRLEAKTK